MIKDPVSTLEKATKLFDGEEDRAKMKMAAAALRDSSSTFVPWRKQYGNNSPIHGALIRVFFGRELLEFVFLKCLLKSMSSRQWSILTCKSLCSTKE